VLLAGTSILKRLNKSPGRGLRQGPLAISFAIQRLIKGCVGGLYRWHRVGQSVTQIASRCARAHYKTFMVECQSVKQKESRMRISLAVVAAAAVISFAAGTSAADPIRSLAQVDVDVHAAPPGVKVEEPRRPGVVVEEPRRPGVVIQETEGRKRDCVTRSQTESSNGVTVTEKERECR
jgi:hypothetical protein